MLGARLPQAALPMVPGPPCLPGDARLGGGGAALASQLFAAWHCESAE